MSVDRPRRARGSPGTASPARAVRRLVRRCPPRPRKFQSRLWLHALLFLLTLVTTTLAGAEHYASFISEFGDAAGSAPLGAAAAGLLVQRHAARDPGRARDGALSAVPTIQRRRDACPTSFRCRRHLPDRHARRGHQDPRGVSEPDGALRHRRRRARSPASSCSSRRCSSG